MMALAGAGGGCVGDASSDDASAVRGDAIEDSTIDAVLDGGGDGTVDVIVDRDEATEIGSSTMDASARDVVDGGSQIPRCIPGAMVGCSCFDGRGGAQVCRPDGTFNPCVCVGSTVDASTGDGPPPTDAASASPVIEIAAGAGRSCALRADGAVYCWGFGDGLPTGSTDTHLTPVRAVGIEDGVALGGVNCVIRRDRSVACWRCQRCGLYAWGESDTLPRVVPGIDDVAAISMVGADMGYVSGACYRSAAGAPLCYGRIDMPGQRPGEGEWDRPVALDRIAEAEQVAGLSSYCARVRSGQVWCWGRGGPSLGDGRATHEQCSNEPVSPWFDCALTPVRVVGIDDAVALSGDDSLCVLRSTGSVACWGTNDLGTLGDGTTTERAAPVAVLGLVDAVQVSVSDQVVCAVRRDESVWCWGSNEFGQLGDGRSEHGVGCMLRGRRVDCSPTQVRVAGLDRIVQVSAGSGHACALQDGGRVFCWGSNRWGELGNNSTVDRNVPVEVRGL